MKPLSSTLSATLLTTLLVLGAALTAQADDRCGEFKWNVTQERSLFAGSARPVMAARDGTAPPALVPAQLYDVTLSPQADVHFPQTPAKKVSVDGAFGGIARVHVAQAGLYRISLDVGAWVDLVDQNKLLPTNDFVGQQGCDAPHKIVQFDLHTGDLVLQLSGSSNQHVHLTITHSPGAAAAAP
jgi:hypothetical protein